MTKSVLVKNVKIGDGAPVSVQTMTNTKTTDVDATVSQINGLAFSGADLVRVTVPDKKSAASFAEIVKRTEVPLIADIHFDGALALAALDAGAAKLRLNPGNTDDRLLKEIVRSAEDKKVPIRVGVNRGSLKNAATPTDLVDACLNTVKKIEDFGFSDLVLAVKSSDVKETVDAYRLLSERCDYPLHIGLTESGFGTGGLIKSCAAIGALLSEGIGDTVRISLSGDPEQEVVAAKRLLNALHLRNDMPEIISCPTCGRTEIDVEGLAKEVESYALKLTKPLKIAVMGCVVNGIGEGKNADLGIAGGKNRSVIFSKGKILCEVENDRLKEKFLEILKEYER